MGHGVAPVREARPLRPDQRPRLCMQIVLDEPLDVLVQRHAELVAFRLDILPDLFVQHRVLGIAGRNDDRVPGRA